MAVVGLLAIFAWIGCLMDNLLLMYLMGNADFIMIETVKWDDSLTDTDLIF